MSHMSDYTYPCWTQLLMKIKRKNASLLPTPKLNQKKKKKVLSDLEILLSQEGTADRSQLQIVATNTTHCSQENHHVKLSCEV